MRVFLSKILSDVLPVAEGIKSRGMKIDITCQVCGDGSESVNHLFFTCPFARRVWADTNLPAQRNGFHNSSIFQNIVRLVTILETRRTNIK